MDTTQSTASTRKFSASRAGRPLGLIWVFPEARFTPLSDSKVLLGRAGDCQVVLPGVQVSRRHASLTRNAGTFALKDLGSKNGTYVNGGRVSQRSLATQDVVRIGEWVGVVGRQADAGATELGDTCVAGAALLEALARLRAAAPSELNVVLVGETGTGKELFARALHSLSGREGALVAVNCAAIPEQLAEAELFGYRKGAFSGANTDGLGHFRAATNGTLFLDEVAELSLSVQAKLLRALESRSVTPLGQSQPIPTGVRVVCAGQAPLDDAVEFGRFRADLYARLNGVEIVLPPLRARREEVAPLFLREFRSAMGGVGPPVSPDVIERLCLYAWPRNVRQLVQAVRQAALFCGSAPLLTIAHLPREIARYEPDRATVEVQEKPGDDSDSVEDCASRARQRRHALERRDAADRDLLLDALRTKQGNVALAAKHVGISRQRAYRIMRAIPELDLETLRAPVCLPSGRDDSGQDAD